jgi:hypothetical protein
MSPTGSEWKLQPAMAAIASAVARATHRERTLVIARP